MSTCGAEATGITRGARQTADFNDADGRQFLHHELGDSIATVEHDLFARIEVDQAHLDLAAVPRIDSPWTVHHTHAMANSQATARVDEGCVSGGQRDRQAGGNQRPLPG